MLGRKDFQVKVNGSRVELPDIEEHLNQHNLVRESAVTTRNNANGSPQLVAFLVADRKSPNLKHLVQSHLASVLPSYMVPQTFNILSEMPLTHTGKVDRLALQKLAATTTTACSNVERTLSDVERTLSKIWSEILGCRQIRHGDSFFELGGQSLLAMQLTSRVCDEFGIEIPVRVIFDTPRLSDYAGRVEVAIANQLHSETRTPILRLERGRPHLLSYSQQRLWYLEQLAPGLSAYHVPAAIRLKGDLRVDCLERSLQRLVQRHEILRTVFRVIEDQPMQVVQSEITSGLERVDLSTQGAAPESRWRQLVRANIAEPFDMTRGPLYRAVLYRIDQEDHVLAMSMHHIVCDGWSTEILVREFGVLYEADLKNEDAGFDDLPVQYADYAQWQRQWLQAPTPGSRSCATGDPVEFL